MAKFNNKIPKDLIEARELFVERLTPPDNKRGHPTKFFELAPKLLDHYCKSYNLHEACKVAGVNYNTAQKWNKDNFHGFADLLREVRESHYDWVRAMLYKFAEENPTVLIHLSKQLPEYKDTSTGEMKPVNIKIDFGDDNSKPPPMTITQDEN